jgi:hypothetical protein
MGSRTTEHTLTGEGELLGAGRQPHDRHLSLHDLGRIGVSPGRSQFDSVPALHRATPQSVDPIIHGFAARRSTFDEPFDVHDPNLRLREAVRKPLDLNSGLREADRAPLDPNSGLRTSDRAPLARRRHSFDPHRGPRDRVPQPLESNNQALGVVRPPLDPNSSLLDRNSALLEAS